MTMPENRSVPSPQPPLPAEAIVARLAASKGVLVALSGGVDSSVVALLAYRAVGPRAVAVTLTGPAVSSDEARAASEVAKAIGIRHIVLSSNPLTDPRYVQNPANRCYFCRTHEGGLLREWGTEHGIGTYLDGVQLDDLGDDRPGLQAMNEHGFQHPLVDAGWTKRDVREFARISGLPNADRPSNACLSSRIAHGQPITAPLLERIAEAERWLADRGFRRVRVRVSGESARVEVDPIEVPRLQSEPTAVALREALAGLGFTSVEIDPQGYRPRAAA